MKKTKKIINLFFITGILVFILIFGMAVIGCDDGSNNDPKEPGEPPDPDKPDYSYDITEPDPSILPNLLIMDDDGTPVIKASQWYDRREEIRTIMQDYSYGQWRYGETVAYEISGNTLTVKVSHNGKNVSFNATVQLPTTGTPPAGGWPVILVFGGLNGAANPPQPIGEGPQGNPRQYALDKGYANISVPTNTVASDDSAHTGAFYTLYPYGSAALQTGVLMAWAWGASKVMDALEAGAAEELNINAKNTIITGTSRNGKAAAVAGAFEERFRITVPVSSGAGGAAMYRYSKANGQIYDLSGYFSYNGGGKWKIDENNPQSLSSIQGDSGGGWFNAKFRTFAKPEDLPFDQHFLFSLCAGKNRYLFMINGFEGDKWTNPPGFFYAFERTMPVFNLLGIPQNIAVSMHRFLHGIEQEDMVKLIKYANFMFYGVKDLEFEFAETEKPKPATWKAFMESLQITPFSASVSPENNAIYESRKPK
jgi:hypothetical protein